MGFCLINNIAVAARAAQEAGARRVWIYDFDVHHGNGTQAIFDADPDVFYVSSHQAGIYPGTGHRDEMGIGPGLGTTINIPLPAGAGPVAFQKIASEILAPSAERFQPDLIMVSAGFDAHWKDPLAGLQMTSEAYFRLAQHLVGIAAARCRGRVVFVTEGGYDPGVVTAGVDAILRAVLPDGRPFEDPYGGPPEAEPELSDVIDRVREIHRLV
jgi:acetoin utilization deacetylase AcuC-like enzyme